MPEPKRCDSCNFWRRDADGLASGLCRRHAPAPLLVPLLDGVPPPTLVALVEPKRDAGDWCGDWGPKPRGNVDPARLELEREVGRLQGIVRGLTERVAAQSELLSKRAEKREG